MNKQRGQTQVLILAGIVILIAIAGGIFYLGRVTVPKPQVPIYKYSNLLVLGILGT